MSRAPASSPGPGAVDEPAAVLEALATTLRRQLSLAQAGDLDGMDELAPAAETLVKRASRLSPAQLGRNVAQIELVRTLWKGLCLALAGQKDELARARGRLHRGKHLAKAYGWPGPAEHAGRLTSIQE